MKNLIRLLSVLVLIVSLNSCGVNWKINSYDTNNIDDIYDVEVIQTQSQLDWKLRTDWTFANNYYLFLQRQNYTFFQNQYYYNRLYRFGWNSPHDYWMNWQWNWHNRTHWNTWNQYPYYGNWNNNYWWNYQNRHPYYSHIYGRNSFYGKRLQTYRNLSNTNRKIYQRRTTKSNRNTIVKPINNTRPVINTRPINNTPPRVIRTKPVINNNNTRPVIRNNNTNPKYTPSRKTVTPTRTTTTKRGNNK